MENETGVRWARPRSRRSLAAETTFLTRLAELGATLIEREWLGSDTAHRVRCAAGHDCRPRPASVQQGRGICLTCAGHDPKLTEARFRARLAELGATLLEPQWRGVHYPHHVRCANDHDCRPRPNGVLSGQGICKFCASRDSGATWIAFKGRIAELGGQVLEAEWLGCGKPHKIRCPRGHEGTTRPNWIQQGGGMCRVCAGSDPSTAEASFRRRVAEAGGVVVGPYIDARTPVLILCKAGHQCRRRPSGLRNSAGICRACVHLDAESAAEEFHLRVAMLGGTVEGKYVNAHTPVLIYCAAGHECKPSPHSLQKGGGLCRICARQDPATAEAAFRQRLNELGATFGESNWLGSMKPHYVICSAGHDCWPRPAGVGQGQGICPRCAGKAWDAFYIVRSDSTIKFGITTGEGRPRLRLHKAAGYRTLIRLLLGLPGQTAEQLERDVLSTLRLAGWKPVKGREYFDIDALAVVLDVVDNYPIDTQQEVA